MANIGATQFSKTYKSWANGYRALVENSFKKGIDYRQGVFYTDSTENWEDRLVELETPGDFGVWEDGDTPSTSELREGYQKTVTQVPYGMRYIIGRLFTKYEGKDVRSMKRSMLAEGKKAYRLQQLAPYSMLSYGFSNTNTYLTGVTGATVSALGPDGKRLFSTVHPASPNNTTTWSNVLSDNAVVGESALQAMIDNLHNQIDADGERKYYGEEGYIWLVSLEDWAEATRVVGSDKRAGVNDNDMNVYKGGYDGRAIEVRAVPWLNSNKFSGVNTHAHFLVAKGVADTEMNLCQLTSEEFYTYDYTEEATRSVYVGAGLNFNVAFLSGRGIVGSQGTGTGTYSA